MNKEAVTKSYDNSSAHYEFGSLRIIKSIIGQSKIVLDVGCADGALARFCEGNTFYGIDANTHALEKAAKICKEIKYVDLNKAPEQPVFDTKFDFIVFADVLEHLLYPTEILNHFRPYLKEDGKIIVSLPNIGIWRSRLNLLLGKFDYTDYGVMDRTHLHLYTFKTGKELLEQSGYTVISEQGATYSFGKVVTIHPILRDLFSVHTIFTAQSTK